MSIALIVGDRHGGKTSACQRLARLMCSRGLTVGGIVAPAVHEGGSCVGYEVVDMATGRSARLAAVDAPGVERVGRFQFLPEGLALGRAALRRAIDRPSHLVIVDEVGPLELAGGGWAEYLDPLADRSALTVFTVRRNLAAPVAARWKMLPISQHDLASGVDQVVDTIARLVEPPAGV